MVTLAELEIAAKGEDRAHAITLALAAVKQGLRGVVINSLVAEGLEAQGRLQEALILLERATRAAPGDAQLWFRQGRVLLALDRREAARAATERGLALAPVDYRGLVDAGTVCLRLGDLAASRTHLTRAAELAPDRAEPASALAVVAGLAGSNAEARDLAARALALDPTLISAQIAIARADLAEHAFDVVEDRLTRLLARTDLADVQRVDAHDLRADARDALGRPGEAFADYAARNAILRRVHAPRFADPAQESPPDRTRRLAAWFEARPAMAWAGASGADTVGAAAAGGHAFVLGFPRSGTTLLEKALAGHARVACLEEVDVLATVSGGLLADGAALSRLASLTPAQALPLREAYWRGVSQTLGAPIGGRVVVDKLPLHTPALPVIARLFPDATILFALRDPRDVVLSCFRRRFRTNAAMYAFLTLEGAAAYYDAVMRLAALYAERLALRLQFVRHEAVVADFDGEVAKVLEAMGLAWDPGVRDFAALAAASAPRTPSAPQLARGLNAEGIGQWRRYEAQLAPVRGVLAPWVERFGYGGS